MFSRENQIFKKYFFFRKQISFQQPIRPEQAARFFRNFFFKKKNFSVKKFDFFVKLYDFYGNFWFFKKKKIFRKIFSKKNRGWFWSNWLQNQNLLSKKKVNLNFLEIVPRFAFANRQKWFPWGPGVPMHVT